MKQKRVAKSSKGNSKRLPLKSPGKTIHDPFEDFLSRKPLLVSGSILIILFFLVFSRFLSGRYYYLFKDIGSDTINFFYPLQYYSSYYIHHVGFPKWSHAEGMGQSIMSSSLMNPFYWILYLSGTENIQYALIWMEIIKIGITYFIVHRLLAYWNLTEYSKITGSLLYCFSSFMIVGGSWYQFSTEAFLLAMLLLAFEKLYHDRSWYLFPVSVALISVYQPFDLYLFGVFLVIYLLFRHFSSETHSWKGLVRVIPPLLSCSILGLAIASFMLVSNIFLLIDSPRVGGNSGYFNLLMSRPVLFTESRIYYATVALRLFGNDLLGNGSHFKGWYNYLEAPMFYIGLLPLLLFTQTFTRTVKRFAIASAILMTIFIIPVIFPYFRYFFWLFTGDYYRAFSFFFSLSVLVLGLVSLDDLVRNGKVNLTVLIITFAVLAGLLYYPYSNSGLGTDNEVQAVVRNFLILYFILILLIRLKIYSRLALVALFIAFTGEIAWQDYQTVNSRDALAKSETLNKSGYNDYTTDAVQYINSTDRPFFRVFKDYSSGPAIHTSINDAKVQGFYGTSSYESFNQKYYIRFLEESGIISKGNETESRWAPGLGSRPLLLNLASNKFVFSNKSEPDHVFKDLQYDSVAQLGNIKVYRNRHYLPMGYTYRKYLSFETYKRLSPMRKDFAMQEAAVIEQDNLKNILPGIDPYDLKDTSRVYNLPDYFSDLDELKKDTLQISDFGENRISGKIKPGNPVILFFSIPYDRGWKAGLDGKETRLLNCNIGFMGILVPPGEHSVELYYTPPYFRLSLIISIAGLILYGCLFAVSKMKRRKSVSQRSVSPTNGI